MKPWRKCCHFRDKALCHVLLQPSLPPSEKKEGRKALVAAVYGLGSPAADAALLTDIIHAWHLNAPIQNLSFPHLPYCFPLPICTFTACTIWLLVSRNYLKSEAWHIFLACQQLFVAAVKEEEGNAMRGVARISFPMDAKPRRPSYRVFQSIGL